MAIYQKSKVKSESGFFPKVKDCPPAGQGVHHWVFHVACTFTKAGMAEEKISEYCEERGTRILQPNEVENAIGSYIFQAPSPLILIPAWGLFPVQ